MASRGQSLTIAYVAWDTFSNAGKTGDGGNHTLRWIKDGTPAAPANSPSEVDPANAPGVYKITLTAGECTCDVGVLAGKSSTGSVAIIPVVVTFEQLATAIADAVLARDVDQVEASAPEHSLCTVVLAALESQIVGSTWTIKRTDGSTTHATKTVTTDADAEPITGVS
jgi:hypothetical protein